MFREFGAKLFQLFHLNEEVRTVLRLTLSTLQSCKVEFANCIDPDQPASGEAV